MLDSNGFFWILVSILEGNVVVCTWLTIQKIESRFEFDLYATGPQPPQLRIAAVPHMHRKKQFSLRKGKSFLFSHLIPHIELWRVIQDYIIGHCKGIGPQMPASARSSSSLCLPWQASSIYPPKSSASSVSSSASLFFLANGYVPLVFSRCLSYLTSNKNLLTLAILIWSASLMGSHHRRLGRHWQRIRSSACTSPLFGLAGLTHSF